MFRKEINRPHFITQIESMENLELPRTEFLLRRVKMIEDAIITWYKKNHYSQGDGYSVRVTRKGKWEVTYTNDYPMQHGDGQSHLLSEADFAEATKDCFKPMY
jgi:hypothetical protein